MQTVLIADDSLMRRQRLDEALSRVGYFTILTGTAQEALGILRSVHVDLLVCRERLADVEGSALAGIARHRGLDELVVVALAGGEGSAQRALEEGVVDAVLDIGLDAESVVEVVRRLLRPVVVRTPPPAVSAMPCALAKA